MIKKRLKNTLRVPVADAILTDEDWAAAMFDGFVTQLFVSGNQFEFDFPDSRWDFFMGFKGFRPELCVYLFRHMARGLSYESFGARYGVLPAMKKRWEKELVEWRIARDFGQVAQLETWEELGLQITKGEIQYGNSAVWNANMKARYRDMWGDRKEVAHEVNHGGKIELKMEVAKSGVRVLEDGEGYQDAEIL